MAKFLRSDAGLLGDVTLTLTGTSLVMEQGNSPDSERTLGRSESETATLEENQNEQC